jgi:hypothetical protein
LKPSTARRAAWLGLCLFLGAGCGLKDYEARMLEEQRKLERLDRILTDEDRFLGDPLRMPPDLKVETTDAKKNKIVELVEPLPPFFIRPPRGVDPRPGAPGGHPPHALYPYRGGSFVVYLGGTSDPKKKPDDFRKEVCNTLGISTKLAKDNVTQDTLGSEPNTWRSKPLEFSKLTANHSGYTFFVYLTQRDQDQFAVVFQVASGRAKSEEVPKTITTSLGTLEVGGLATLVARAYQQKDRRSYSLLRMSKEPIRYRR